MNKKKRRHNGWRYPKIFSKCEDIYTQPYWDDCNERRDGFRRFGLDKTLIKSSNKNKKLLIIRKKRKNRRK